MGVAFLIVVGIIGIVYLFRRPKKKNFKADDAIILTRSILVMGEVVLGFGARGVVEHVHEEKVQVLFAGERQSRTVHESSICIDDGKPLFSQMTNGRLWM